MLEPLSVPFVPPPAPGEEDHVSLQLANSSIRMSSGRIIEMLGSPTAATCWLIERDLAPQEADLQEHCASLMVALRGNVRDVFGAVTSGNRPSAESVTSLNRALTRTPSAPLLVWHETSGFSSQLTHPTTQIVEHALAAIANDAVALVTGKEGALLIACGAEQCNRYLLRTHARRHWCSKRCGDRIRAARAYARKRTQSEHAS